MTDSTCPICNRPGASSSTFCDDHVQGWLLSKERAEVDFSSDDSYLNQSICYAISFINQSAAVQGDDE